MHFAGQLTPDEFWARMGGADDEVRRTFGERPIYAVHGWPGRGVLSEWSFGSYGSGIRSLAFLPPDWNGVDLFDAGAGPRVDVLVDVTEPRRMVAERMAFEVFERGGDLQWPADEPSTPDAIIDVVVDGVAEPFELWSTVDRSWASGRVGGVTVLVETAAHPMADVALERVRDIEPFISERRRWITEQRGGR